MGLKEAQTSTFLSNFKVKLGAYLAGNHWRRRVKGFKVEKEGYVQVNILSNN